MKQTTNNSAKNMATIITVPHLTSDGGISPKRLRTFSERNSISVSFFISTLIILKLHFHYLYVHNQAFWMFFCHNQSYIRFSELHTG